MNDKQIKMTFLGNSGVGKSTFMSNLLKPKNQSNSNIIDKQKQLKQNQYMNVTQIDVYTQLFNKKYKVNIVQPIGWTKKMDENYTKNQKLLIQKRDIAVIFMDISNTQSFSDIAQLWLKSSKSITPKKIILLINKIDKQSSMSLGNILDFCYRNQIEFFFSSNQIDCINVLNDIIIWYQSRKQGDQLKSKNQQELNKSGFFGKIFGVGLSASTNNDQNYKKKLNQLAQSWTKKLLIIKKGFEQNTRRIDARIQNICKFLKQIGIPSDDKKQQLTDRLLLLQQYISKLKIKLDTQKQQNNKYLHDYLKQKDDCNFYKKQLDKSKKQLDKSKSNQINKQKQMELIINQFKSSQNNKQLEFNKIVKQLKDKQNQHIKKLKFLRDEVFEYKKKIQFYSKQEEKYLTFNQLKKKQHQQSLNTLKSTYQSKLQTLSSALNLHLLHLSLHNIFQQSRLLRQPNIQYLSKIINNIQKYQQKQISQTKKIYQFDLCSNNSIHSYLQMHSNLIYIIQISQIIFIIYINEVFRKTINQQPPKNGLFMIYYKSTNTLRNFQLSNKTQLWKYDPLNLVFSKNQLVIRFNKKQPKNTCTITITDKKQSIFLSKNNHFNQLFQINDINSKNGIDIQYFQVLQLFFK